MTDTATDATHAPVTPPARVPARIHPRHRVDATRADLLHAAWACLVAWRRPCRIARLERRWGTRAIAFLSVRSAFDALLSALDPAGGEIAMSALTIDDMATIARAHGLEVVAVDVDPATMAPSAASLADAVGPRTRAIVVCHLFGGTTDLTAAAAVARANGIPLVVDAAQAVNDPTTGLDELADVTLHSFGSLKTATALGGAIAHVRDPRIAARMRSLQATWPRQARAAYLRRVVRHLGLLALAHPRAYALLVRRITRRGGNPDEVINNLTRGFGGDPGRLLARIRQSPSAPLLATMRRRLRRFPAARLRVRAMLGQRIGRAAPALLHVGGAAADHSHWMVPIASFKPDGLVRHLRENGFDATPARATNLVALPGAPVAATVLARSVLVPAYPELGAAEARRLECLLRCWREFDVASLDDLRVLRPTPSHA